MEIEDAGFPIPDRLAAGYECFRVTIPAGTDHPTSAEDWSGALVVVEQGADRGRLSWRSPPVLRPRIVPVALLAARRVPSKRWAGRRGHRRIPPPRWGR